jgi:hypothetical protein
VRDEAENGRDLYRRTVGILKYFGRTEENGDIKHQNSMSAGIYKKKKCEVIPVTSSGDT